MPLTTIGHGTASQQALVDLLVDAGVELVVDVRRFPGSRRHPHVAREALERWLPEAGLGYRWEPRLGGRRRPDPRSPHHGLRNASFRAYADHMGSEEFREAVLDLLDQVGEQNVSVLCSESLWWRCHRRLIADYVTELHDQPVRHLLHDGKSVPHVPTDAVRVVHGLLRYDRSPDAAEG